MSTERSLVVKSIRRIALSAPALRQAMDAIQARGDQPASVGVGTSDADRDRLCCDGSTSSNPNPGVDERDTSDGQEGLDSGDPADISDMGGGCLSGVTDCATGDAVCFCGDGWIPPEGWDGPIDPPTADGYKEGVYWDRSNSCLSSHPCGVIKCVVEDECRTVLTCSWDGSCVDYTMYDSCVDDESQGRDCGITSNDCNGSTEDYCTDVPYLDSWPSDGCTNLAIKNGTIVGSKYDPDQDGSYSTPMDEIKFCDEFGNSFWLRPSSTGGWKTIDVNKEAGYLWDKQGNKIAHINGAEYSDPGV